MTDEQPKRVRGQQAREAAYRQGFLDGVEYGLSEMTRQRELLSERTIAADASLAKYRRTITAEPKRRRKKVEGVAMNPDVARVS